MKKERSALSAAGIGYIYNLRNCIYTAYLIVLYEFF